MNVTIRPITVKDYESFFKEKPARTIRGNVIILDDRVVAVYGVLLFQQHTMLFSDMVDDLDVSPIIIWRWSKRAMELLNDIKQPILAVTQDSCRYLESLGFRYEKPFDGAKLYRYIG